MEQKQRQQRHDAEEELREEARLADLTEEQRLIQAEADARLAKRVREISEDSRDELAGFCRGLLLDAARSHIASAMDDESCDEKTHGGAGEPPEEGEDGVCFGCGHGEEHHKHGDACRFEDCACPAYD